MSDILINKSINSINQKKIICKNILHMFSERKLLEKNNIEKIYNNIIKSDKELSTFEIKLLDNKILSVNFIEFKITSLKKIDNIEKIINNGKHNLFVIKNIQKKIWEQLINYNIEVFFKYELMVNIIDHELVPEHTILTEEENKELHKSYICTNKQLPKIQIYDIISRYYNAKLKDVFKIKRKNISSGYSIYYRVVIPGSLPDEIDV